VVSKYQRRKGHDFERDVRRAFAALFPDAKRGLQSQADHECPDVSAGPFHIECKVGARPSPFRALEQAEEKCAPNRVPVAVCKVDRDNPVITMRLHQFFTLLAVLEAEAVRMDTSTWGAEYSLADVDWPEVW